MSCGALPTRPARKAPQALVDVAAIRQRLLGFGWVKDARVSHRLPDTLVIDIVERTPSALWQSDGQLALIEREGVVLDRVPVDKMPDLPLVIGPGANGQARAARPADGRGPDAQAAARFGQLGRRPPLGLNFQSGETVALPEGEERRQSRADQVRPPRQAAGLLGRGILRFDLRVPGKMIVRLPRAPGEPIAPAAAAAGGLVAQPPDQPLIAALDIGSSKVSAMIARADEDGRLTVLGTGQRESRGVKRGFITDMAASEFAVREAVELAERMSGLTVEDVWAELRRRRPRQRPRQCRGRAWRPRDRAGRHRPAAAGRQGGHRQERPGRAPRPSGAVHHRPRAGRPAADRPPRQQARRRHPRHRRRAVAAAQYRYRHPPGAPWRARHRRLADRRRRSPASARRSASSASRWSRWARR